MVINDNNKIDNLKKRLIQIIEELMDFVSQAVSERTLGRILHDHKSYIRVWEFLVKYGH